ncbi:MAG TPA: ABC transporter permease [Gaiellaceae bacterium]|nr:ABC transporter permease [Gaiellaceae bacterium]
MLVYVLKRLGWSVVVFLTTMLLTFALMRGIGGTPFHASEGSSVPLPVQYRLSDYYRLDQPWPVQFGVYLWHIVRLDFGPMLSYRDASLTPVMKEAVPVSLELSGLAAAVAVVVGFALGLLAALRRGRLAGAALTALASVLVAVPVFLFAEIGREYVAGTPFATAGWGSPRSEWLPVLVLALAPAGYIARLVRAGVVEALGEDYVRAAQAKGLRRRRVLLAHVLPNALTPFLAAAVPVLALLITSAFFVEQTFRIPGAASLFIESADRRDYPAVLGLTAVLALLVVLSTLAADVVAAALDPRLREARR